MIYHLMERYSRGVLKSGLELSLDEVIQERRTIYNPSTSITTKSYNVGIKNVPIRGFDFYPKIDSKNRRNTNIYRGPKSKAAWQIYSRRDKRRKKKPVPIVNINKRGKEIIRQIEHRRYSSLLRTLR
jgi:hypothetical protein